MPVIRPTRADSPGSSSQDETCYVVVYRNPNAASQAATANFSIDPAPAPQALTTGVWLNQNGGQRYDYSVTITQPTTFFMDSDSGAGVNTAVYGSNGNLVAGPRRIRLGAATRELYFLGHYLINRSPGNIPPDELDDVSALASDTSQ